MLMVTMPKSASTKSKTNLYIVTRYNIGLYNTLRKRPGRAEEWMAHRLDTFANYTVPSIRQQTCTNFEWVILFDSKTPSKYWRRIHGILKGINFSFIHVEWPTGQRFKERLGSVGWRVQFAEHVRNGCDTVATLRLDNDDALNLKAVEVMWNHIKGFRRGQCVIDTPCGVMWDVTTGEMYLAQHPVGSPVLCYVEPTGRKRGVRTVYYDSHHKVATHAELRRQRVETYPRFPMWLMVMHGQNTTNRIIKKMIAGPVQRDEIKRWFGV